jgi:hypothetical protein
MNLTRGPLDQPDFSDIRKLKFQSSRTFSASVTAANQVDDLRIAARLGLNRQRVIDLRRAARERLNN